MIEIVKTPMEKGNEHELKSLFGKTGFKMLENVILGRLTKHSVEATNKAIESGKYPNMSESAETELKHAIRYQTALEVLDEVRKMESFETVTTKITNPPT